MKPTLPLWALAALFLSDPAALAQKTAVINQVITTPTIVNLYWDVAWDTHNPTLKMGTIDAVTRAVVDSTYFAGLAEYGVTSVAFGGSFLPDPSCPSMAPSSVGFYDPFNTSIAGFVQCEHDNGPAVLRAAGVIYNVILPPFSMESDFWSRNFCTGPGSPLSWHYHGLEDTLPPPFGSGPFSGPPFYTIILSNPACGGNAGLFHSMFHEVLEAITDPFPVNISIIPPHAVVSITDEIADTTFCGDVDITPLLDPAGVSPLATPPRIPIYWSNSKQACVSFGDRTQPVIGTAGVTNWGSQTAFTISGSGFGTIPASTGLPSSTLPYLVVQNATQNWEAGSTINGDNIGLVVPDWSDTQVNNVGLREPSGTTVNNVPGVPLTLWVCNPESLKCTSRQTTSAAGPYDPRLRVLNIVSGEFVGSDAITIALGSRTIMQHNVQGLCQPCVFATAPMTLAPGAYAFTQKVSGTSPMRRVSNGCQQVVLALGEEESCIISDLGPPPPPPPHCPPGKPNCRPQP
jgi:hypothetical protein